MTEHKFVEKICVDPVIDTIQIGTKENVCCNKRSIKIAAAPVLHKSTINTNAKYLTLWCIFRVHSSSLLSVSFSFYAQNWHTTTKYCVVSTFIFHSFFLQISQFIVMKNTITPHEDIIHLLEWKSRYFIIIIKHVLCLRQDIPWML